MVAIGHRDRACISLAWTPSSEDSALVPVSNSFNTMALYEPRQQSSASRAPGVVNRGCAQWSVTDRHCLPDGGRRFRSAIGQWPPSPRHCVAPNC